MTVAKSQFWSSDENHCAAGGVLASSVFRGHSVRKIENHCLRVSETGGPLTSPGGNCTEWNHFWDGCRVFKALSHSRLRFTDCKQSLVRLLCFRDDFWNILLSTTAENNSIKRQGVAEEERAEKLQSSGESFKIRTGWDLDHSRLILSLPFLSNI